MKKKNFEPMTSGHPKSGMVDAIDGVGLCEKNQGAKKILNTAVTSMR